MPDFDGTPLLQQPAPDLEETAGTIQGHDARPSPLDGCDLPLEHLAGHVWVVGGEVTSKATALPDLVQLPELVPPQHPQEASLGFLNPQAAKSATRIVVRQGHLFARGAP